MTSHYSKAPTSAMPITLGLSKVAQGIARRVSNFLMLTLLLGIVTLNLVYAQSVTTTVTAGSSPRAVAINPVTNRIFVTNFVNDNVTVIDGATRSGRSRRDGKRGNQ